MGGKKLRYFSRQFLFPPLSLSLSLPSSLPFLSPLTLCLRLLFLPLTLSLSPPLSLPLNPSFRPFLSSQPPLSIPFSPPNPFSSPLSIPLTFSSSPNPSLSYHLPLLLPLTRGTVDLPASSVDRGDGGVFPCGPVSQLLRWP